MNSVVILLHRPFIAHWELHQLSTGQAPFDTLDPAKLCIGAAKSICIILEIHSEYLSLLPADLIFIIFTVAGILFHECQKLTPDNAELPQVHQYLRNCIKWLQIFGAHWKNAGARQELFNSSRYYEQVKTVAC
jgi:hypothetical protein